MVLPHHDDCLTMIQHANDGARVRHASESSVRLFNRENLRLAYAADTFELVQVRKVSWKLSGDPLENARSIIKRQRNKRAPVKSQFIKPDEFSPKHNLLIKRERNRTVISHTETELNSTQQAARVDQHCFVLSVLDRYRVVENDPNNQMNGDFDFLEKDCLGASCTRVGDIRCEAN
jgi:hypothetical protein